MFKTRLISGIILVIIALLTIIPGGYILAGTTLFLALVAFNELYKSLHINIPIIKNIGYLGIFIYYILLVFSPNKEYLFLSKIQKNTPTSKRSVGRR